MKTQFVAILLVGMLVLAAISDVEGQRGRRRGGWGWGRGGGGGFMRGMLFGGLMGSMMGPYGYMGMPFMGMPFMGMPYMGMPWGFGMW